MRACLLIAAAAMLVSPLYAQAPPAEPRTAEAAPARRIQVDLAEVPLRDAIQRVLTGSGIQYTLDANVPNVAIDLKLRDVSPQQALRLVVRQAAASVPGLTVTQEMDIYIIRIRPVDEQERIERNAAKPFWIRSDVVTEKIPLRFVDAAAVSTALGGTVISVLPPKGAGADTRLAAVDGPGGRSLLYQPTAGTTVFGVTADNSLVVLGTRHDIDKLRQLARFLDVPSGEFQVRVTAGKLSAGGLTRGGARLRLSDTARGDQFHLNVVLRAGIEGIELAIDGELVTGGTRRNIVTYATLQRGTATQVAVLGSGSRETRLWIRVEPTTTPRKRQE